MPETIQQSHTPRETLEYIGPLFNAFGITRIANVTGLDQLNVPVYTVCRPNSRSLAITQGKGITNEIAQISGIMESIECFHAEHIATPLLFTSYANLEKDGNAMNVRRLSRLKDTPWSDDFTMAWISGKNLLNGRELLVPMQSVHMDCRNDVEQEPLFFVSDTNGLASGTTTSDAIVHGLYEIIERDAMALWSLTPDEDKRARKVTLASVANLFFRDFRQACSDINLQIGVWDITSDMGVPTYICKLVSDEYNPTGVRPAFGSGSHISRETALLKAVTEAAQSRLTFIAGARDDQYSSVYESQLSHTAYQRWHAEIESDECLPFTSGAYDAETMSAEEIKALLLEKFASHGFEEVMCIDLTKPEYGIPVVKTIVAGMEGITFSGRRLIGDRGKSFYQKSRTTH